METRVGLRTAHAKLKAGQSPPTLPCPCSSAMTILSSDHFQRRAREHYDRISALSEGLARSYDRSEAESAARIIKAQLLVDREWANSSARVHSLQRCERTALSAICTACATLNLFRVGSNPARWAPHVSDAEATLARYAMYAGTGMTKSSGCSHTEPGYTSSANCSAAGDTEKSRQTNKAAPSGKENAGLVCA
jgi:hypothetical protein